MLASASCDATVALLDFKTGKKLYTGKTSVESNFSFVINNNYCYILRGHLLSLLYLRKFNFSKEGHKGISRE